MTEIGNFYVDLTRSTLYILLPLSFVLAVVLMSQGVVQSFAPYRTVSCSTRVTIEMPVTNDAGEPVVDAAGEPLNGDRVVTEQTVPLGPAASQIAIKQLGTNGGGFFNVNSAHPFENPTPLCEFPRGARDPADSRRRSATRSAGWSATRGRAGPCSPRCS